MQRDAVSQEVDAVRRALRDLARKNLPGNARAAESAEIDALIARLDAVQQTLDGPTDAADTHVASSYGAEHAAFLEIAAERSPDVLYQIDVQHGTLDHVSAGVRTALGYEPEEVVAWPLSRLLQILHPDDLPYYEAEMRLHAQAPINSHLPDMELRLAHRDGTYRWFNATRTVARHPAEQRHVLVGTLRDVTEQRAAFEALRESEQRYVSLFEHNSEIMLLIDPRNGCIVDANAAALEFYGYSRSEMLSLTIGKINLLSPEALRDAMVRATSQQQRSFRFRHRLASGEIRDVEVLSGPLISQGRKLLFSAVHDVTERVRAEEELHRERDFIASVLDTAGALVVVMDTQGGILRFNRYCETLTGYTLEEVRGRPFYELFLLPEERPEVMHVFDALRRGDYPNQHENWWVARDGSRHLIAWNNTAAIDEQGNVTYIVSTGVDVTERRQAEETLRRNEQLLRAVLDVLPVGMVIADAKGRISHVNRAAHRVWGQPNASGTVPEGARARWPETNAPVEPHEWGLDRALARGEVILGEEMMIEGADGDHKTILGYAVPIHGPADEIAGAVAVHVDITDRKRTERLLHQRLEDLSALYHASQTLLDNLDIQRILHDVCQLTVELFGFRMAWVGLTPEGASQIAVAASAGYDNGYTALIHLSLRGSDEHLPVVRGVRSGEAVLTHSLATDPTFTSPWRQAALENGYQAQAVLPMRAEGRVVGVLAVYAGDPDRFTDERLQALQSLANLAGVGLQKAGLHEKVQLHAAQLERRVAERTAALRASEARFRAIFEEAAIGIALVGLDGRLLAGNEALERMLGYDGPSLQGRALIELIHSEDAPTDAASFAELVAGERNAYKRENRFLHRDGSVLTTSTVTSLVRGARGRPEFAIVMVQDVSEEKKVQQALLHSEKLAATGKLAASFVHEIGNPLQAVIGCLGLADETLEEGGDVRKYLTVAREELTRASGMVRQLRDLHRPPQQDRHVSTDVNALIDQVLTVTSKQAQDRGVRIGWKPTADLPAISAIPDQLKQVFLNLVLNALDAMPSGGDLRISTHLDLARGQVVAAFADTGQGITREALSHIFESFFSTKEDGLGLGLYLSQDVVRRHGGQIQVESTPGKGTTFTVRLPAIH
ncbi:MAG: PAS domain S-box protein [Anaerolineae bacterium]